MIKLILIFSLLPSSPFFLQTQGGLKLGWNQPAASLAEATSFTYKYYPDNSLNGVTVTATCSGTASPFLCIAGFPVFTPGQHTLTMTATSQEGLESPKSSPPLGFTVPGTPVNPRIIP
jgi:hypothetical protein